MKEIGAKVTLAEQGERQGKTRTLEPALDKRKEWQGLTIEEKKPYEDEAKRIRVEANARGAPVKRALEALSEPEVFAGPWSLFATRGVWAQSGRCTPTWSRMHSKAKLSRM